MSARSGVSTRPAMRGVASSLRYGCSRCRSRWKGPKRLRGGQGEVSVLGGAELRIGLALLLAFARIEYIPRRCAQERGPLCSGCNYTH